MVFSLSDTPLACPYIHTQPAGVAGFAGGEPPAKECRTSGIPSRAAAATPGRQAGGVKLGAFSREGKHPG